MASVQVQSPSDPSILNKGNHEIEEEESTDLISFQTIPYSPSITLQDPYPSNTVFPLALSPSKAGVPLPNLLDSIKRLSTAGKIRELLNTHGGAIFFKDLGLKSAEEFSQFAQAFGWTPHEDIGNPVRRTVVAFNVATANEGPNTMPVYPHNEFGLSPHYPAYVFFYCASAPETGGETPINNSIVLYERLRERVPEFVDELAEKGVKYQLFYPNKPRSDTSSAGTSVLQSYGLKVLDTDSVEEARKKIELEIQRLPTATWTWENQSDANPLGDLRVWQRLPALRIHNQTGRTTFFNNMISRFLSAQAAGSLDPPHINKDGRYQPPAFYGDGSPIPHRYLQAAVDIIKETRSLITWKEGDVLLLDNLAVQHAREPWTG
ncbi:hypothetical protein VTN77DRAFT_3451 [Rasamsonia byssochlamydoides]|uniref:uncharacterized protein n=1 Tax=Rasamsonia byssochlamydoides TaxID=89139 RepID=UPI003744A084